MSADRCPPPAAGPKPAALPATLRLLLALGALTSTLPGQTTPMEAQVEARRIAEEIARAAAAARERDQVSILQERFQQDQWLDEHNLRDLVLLPPIPPTLVGAQPDLPALLYPPLLTDFVGEPFFMALSNLYFQRLLKPVHIERLEKYRTTRDALAEFLHTVLADADSEAGRGFLAVVARNQQADLDSLATEAEGIRAALAALDRGTALAKKRDADATLKTPGLRPYLSALYAAHYEDGLSIEQRELLHEIAIETQLAEAKNPGPGGFFLPATARIHWPDLPPAARAAQEQFASLRTTLRDELATEVVATARKGGKSKRGPDHSPLAARQAPKFAELQRLAEEIRLAAAGLAFPGQPAPAGHPAELVALVGAALDAKEGFRHHSARRVKQLDREFAPARFKVVVENNEPRIEEIAATAGKAAPKPDDARRQRLATVNEEIRREYQETSRQVEAARAALAHYHETLPADGRPTVSQLSAAFAQAHALEQSWHQLAGFRRAALLPGLSPAQRRLLFNTAFRAFEKHRLKAAD